MESPPVDFDDPETPIADDPDDRTFHLVLIDNGRMAMREDEQLRETLYCIRCGAYANSCANFQSVGGFDPLVEGLTPDAEPDGIDPQKRFFGNFATVARAGSATAPLSNWLADTRPARAILERTLGVDRRRDLPEFRQETLRRWFRGRGGSRVSPADAERDGREVVLYPVVYTNHVQVERGKAAVRTLEALLSRPSRYPVELIAPR